MMIHFVVRDNWAVGRVARGWAAHIPGSTVGERENATASVNVFCPYQLLTSPTPGFNVAWFTHRREDAQHRQAWKVAIDYADLCIAMCRKTADMLPPAKTQIIRTGTDAQFFAPGPVRFLVVAKAQEQNRKRLDWVPRLKMLNTEWRVTGGAVPWRDMPATYAWADYIVILSDNEGGPMCVPEALAMKKPIIAPDVGFCWDWPVIRYKTVEDLAGIIEQLARANDPAREGQKVFAQALVATIESAGGDPHAH